MQIKKISLRDFSEAFNRSFDTGVQYYYFFVVLAGLDLVFNAVIESSVLHSVFVTFFQAGIIYIAQTAIEDNQHPSLSQYFVAFTRGWVMERLKSIVIFNVILTIAMVYAAGFALVRINTLVDQTVLASSPLVMFSVVFVFTLISMPFLFVPYILVLQNNSWSRSFGISFDGFKRNFIVYFVAFLMPFPLAALLDPELYNLNDRPLTSILKALYCLAMPLFALFYYNLYKKLFVFDTPDVKIKTTN